MATWLRHNLKDYYYYTALVHQLLLIIVFIHAALVQLSFCAFGLLGCVY